MLSIMWAPTRHHSFAALMYYKFSEELWVRFLEKERANKFRGKRSYLHFDPRINFKEDVLSSLDSFRVEFEQRYGQKLKSFHETPKHPFYPFIQYTLQTKRYKYDKNLGRRKLSFKKRPISYAAHLDSLILSWHTIVLDNYFEEYLAKNIRLSSSILAYRKFEEKLSNIDFAFSTFKKIQDKGDCIVLAYDIENFFSSIPHKQLYDNWLKIHQLGNPKLKQLPEPDYKIFKLLTQYTYVKSEVLTELFAFKHKSKTRTRICTPQEYRQYVRGSKMIQQNEKLSKPGYTKSGAGIPQGTPISALLANISMISIDDNLNALLESGESYFRYSDDLIFVLSPDRNIDEFDKHVKAPFHKLHLNLNDDKTEFIQFVKKERQTASFDLNSGKPRNLQYLGFEFNGKMALIRSASMSKYHARMHRNVRNSVSRTLGKKSKSSRVFKRKLINRFTSSDHETNFISYALRAANRFEIETNIKSQIKNHHKRLSETIDKIHSAKVNKQLRKLEKRK